MGMPMMNHSIQKQQQFAQSQQHSSRLEQQQQQQLQQQRLQFMQMQQRLQQPEATPLPIMQAPISPVKSPQPSVRRQLHGIAATPTVRSPKLNDNSYSTDQRMLAGNAIPNPGASVMVDMPNRMSASPVTSPTRNIRESSEGRDVSPPHHIHIRQQKPTQSLPPSSNVTNSAIAFTASGKMPSSPQVPVHALSPEPSIPHVAKTTMKHAIVSPPPTDHISPLSRDAVQFVALPNSPSNTTSERPYARLAHLAHRVFSTPMQISTATSSLPVNKQRSRPQV